MNAIDRVVRAGIVSGFTLSVFTLSVFTLTACGSSIDGQAVAKPGTVLATSAAPSPETSRPLSPQTQSPPPSQVAEGGDVDIDVEIGDCVELGGEIDDATIENAVCGSFSSNYRVIAKVPTGDMCSPDADQFYYETLGGVEQGALCLDIDWVVGGCMELGLDDPTRIDCDASAVDGVQVTDIVQGADDASVCEDSAYVYDDRRFVVCVVEL